MAPGKRYKKVFDQETSLLAYYGEASPDDSDSEEEPRSKASAHHSSEIKKKEEGNFLTLPTMKHIDIKYLVVREKVQNGVVSIEHIKNTLMLVDPLTKGLLPKLFMDHVARMGLVASLSILD